MTSPCDFFIFSLILIFRVVRGGRMGGVKGQKIAQNDKQKLHPSCTIFQKQYSIWSWFMAHLHGMLFFIFSKFDFSGCCWSKKAGSKWPKMTKNSVVLLISGTINHMIVIFGTHVKWYLCAFLSKFSKFWFSGLLGGWKGKKRCKITKNFVGCASYLRNYIS